VTEPDSPKNETPPVSRTDIDVLLVDDDEMWARSTAQLLDGQRDAFSVETAGDLESAKATFGRKDPDCIVCDYMLEAGTGLDLLAAVRDRDERPFILITGEGDEEIASEAIGQQVTDYVPKRQLGGRNDLLARRIESAVETYRTEQALARQRRSKDAMLEMLRAGSSREGLTRQFCEHLVRERAYDCAWVGTGREGIVPQAVAGDRGYVDEAIDPGTDPAASTEPASLTLVDGEPTVVAPLEEAGDAGPWLQTALEHGFGGAVAVPVVSDGTNFGVLAVYKTEQVVDSDETALLAEYGETLGYALQSAEWKESLFSTSPVTIELAFTDESVPLVAFDRYLPEESRLEHLTAVPQAETVLYLLRVTGTTAGVLTDAPAAIEAVENVTITETGEQLRCELVVDAPTPETIIVDQGGQITDTTVDHGRVAVRTNCTDRTVIQPLVDALRAVYEDVGVRSVGSEATTRQQRTVDELLRSLTEKQRQAIDLAFYNGYYERPREHNTTEIAEKLGVSRPTFTQHLRAAQRKLLSGILEDGDDT